MLKESDETGIKKRIAFSKDNMVNTREKGSDKGMKLLIIHLSDMHFGNGENYGNNNVNSIVNALNTSIYSIQHILIIISGDLTFSGKPQQCIEVAKFLDFLSKAIIQRYEIRDIRFVMVPGNHDVDYDIGLGDGGRDWLEKVENENLFETELPHEIEKLAAFYDLAVRFRCFRNKNLLNKKIIEYGAYRICINLINTAVFSSLDEDMSYHYLRESDVDRLGEQDDCDYVFSVMHHPHSWFNWRVTNKLETVLFEKSDLIFMGHKHYETTRIITDSKNSVHILSGGMLSNQGNWDKSVFHVGILDLLTRNFLTKKYQWEKAEAVYLEKDVHNNKLSKDRYNPIGISVQTEYLNSINQDGFMITNSFLNYFVFPLLEEQKDEKKDGCTNDIDNMEDFLAKLASFKKSLYQVLMIQGKPCYQRLFFANCQ